MPVMRVLKAESGKPVKVWTDDIDENAIEQLKQVSRLPFIHKHVAAMPDVHWGLGATIGSVIASKGAIVPAAVGVDIGCGMMAVKTNLRAEDLPDNLHAMRCAIEQAVPHGRTNNGSKDDKGGWGGDLPRHVVGLWGCLSRRYEEEIMQKHPKARAYNTGNHLGTLGTGNHFIEICLDTADGVWVMLHSGSRGAGNKIGSYFISQAKEEMERYFIGHTLPNKDLAYLVENTTIFNDYCTAVLWAQDFAKFNRYIMMGRIIEVIQKMMPNCVVATDWGSTAINCHHNYVATENHMGANVIVTRKGAIRARKGDMGIIPGSMGARSFIVRGKGNKESFCSCSHGAGRTLGRAEARRRYTAEDLAEQTQGIECPKDDSRVDEIPAAYKSIDQVMANQSDLVEVVYVLRQIVNIKG